ncbi:inosine-5'-monophosphate dehydrogenase [Bacillus coahuilensis p1.1.43]|uniref:Inosine-5'-monophosphate dehydrogenase n=1 Tax=Bacillus coahuilensis p1.1.43 TaxID=1150625 RepID=A0A147K9W8_9BACI|nr:CBS domain-containing protein [Bacillus coahuilensis]KUP07312.1 inosine-5'-monophosphate dehydrogenase [Bacillus coahuilensis p1.1.43]
MKIEDLMTREVEACTLLDNVYEAAVLMKEHNIGSVPIVDGSKLVGMITDRDIVIKGVAEKKPNSSRIQDLMSTNIITVTADCTTDKALEIMKEHQIRRLPVVNGEYLIGMVSLGDLATKDSNNQIDETLEEISEQAH